jgi:hypothetical protein
LRSRLSIDVHGAIAHDNFVAWQADHSLDVVGGIVARKFEDHHVAAFGIGRKDASMEGDEAPGEGVAAITVGKLRDEEVVAHEERLLHGARRNTEGLVEEDADDHS